MNNLPVELILPEMINMSEKDLNIYKMTNKRIYSIYNENKKYIYTEKIKKEFDCIENPKDLYLILKNTPDDIIQNACRINFKRVIKCKDFFKYMKDVIDISNKYDMNIKVQLFMEMFSNILHCFDNIIEKNKNFMTYVRNTIYELNIDIRNSKKISTKIKAKWEIFYNTKLLKLLTKIEDYLKS